MLMMTMMRVMMMVMTMKIVGDDGDGVGDVGHDDDDGGNDGHHLLRALTVLGALSNPLPWFFPV